MGTENDLLTVAELADRLRVRVSWVYGHADQLGAFRLGKYLRFSWVRVLSNLTEVSDRQNRFEIGPQPNDLRQGQ
jgi:hypothetical protein